MVTVFLTRYNICFLMLLPVLEYMFDNVIDIFQNGLIGHAFYLYKP